MKKYNDQFTLMEKRIAIAIDDKAAETKKVT
jgi:hypothetical protein